MKKLITTALSICFATHLFAQSTPKVNFSLAQKMINEQNQQRQAALFVKGNVNDVKQFTESNSGFFKYSAGDISAIVLPIGKVSALAQLENVEVIEDNGLQIQPLNDSMRVKNNINPIQLGQVPLQQAYNGKNVVMGFIDSGIDFTHPDFRDTANNTRVLFIWDHNLTGGVTPQPYNYGREFTAADINAGLAAAHVDNSNGHGTHVTGVGAGDGSALNAHKGVAPEADIISVCVNWNATNWLNTVADGVNYIYTKANAAGKPCVINISAGTYLGSHDGKDLQAQMIDNLISAQNGRSLVAAAGNAGAAAIHLQTNHLNATDTSFTWFTYYAPYGNYVYMEMWADSANFQQMQFAVGADKTNPYYERRALNSFRSVATQPLNVLQTDTIFGFSGYKLARVQRYLTKSAGRYSMIFNIINVDSTSYQFCLHTAGIGKFDLWTTWPQMVPLANIPTAAQFPEIVNYQAPDINQNMVSSFTCSDKVITVGEHNNRKTYIDCDNNLFTATTAYTPGQLTASSSHGPTRDGRQKPDICASGAMTLSVGAAWVLAAFPHTSQGQGCMHIRDGGTSTASPVVAGIAALIFERFPNASWQDVKDCITQNAAQDSFTTSAGALPNYYWGHGKADGFAAMIGCSYLAATNLNADNIGVYAAPNPFTNETVIHFRNNESDNLLIEILNVLGEKIEQHIVAKSQQQITIGQKISDAGIYFYELKKGDKIVKTGKIVKL